MSVVTVKTTVQAKGKKQISRKSEVNSQCLHMAGIFGLTKAENWEIMFSL